MAGLAGKRFANPRSVSMIQMEPSVPPSRMVEGVIRVGIIAILLLMAARVIAPFREILVWGVIVAVGLGPLHLWLMRRLGGSSIHAAVVLTLTALIFIGMPSLLLGDALGSTAYRFAGEIRDGRLEIPPPADAVRGWPLIGPRAYEVWSQASTDLGDLLARSSDRIKTLGGHLLRAGSSAILALLGFFASLLVAGALLAQRERAVHFAEELFDRLAPAAGGRLLRLTEQTVRSVAAGVIGVAIIQAILVGIGLLVAGVPFAGVWSLLCLILGIIQLPMGLVAIPIAIYQLANVPTVEAVLFLVYIVPVMLIDNVLKPILMGRGVEAPMLVIFIGALGGFAASGFIGLFTGAVVLVLVYELFLAWLRQGDPAAVSSTPDPGADA